MIQTVKQVNAFNIFVLGVVVVPAVDVVDACVRFGLYGVVKDEIADGIGVAFSCCLSMGLISCHCSLAVSVSLFRKRVMLSW